MKSSSQVISQFEEIFTALNIKYFNGELKKAIITVGTNSRIQVAQKFVNKIDFWEHNFVRNRA